jgi:hypothetical protein
MRRRARSCRPRRRRAVPVFKHPHEAWAELLVEFREIFRMPVKPKLVEQPPKADA